MSKANRSPISLEDKEWGIRMELSNNLHNATNGFKLGLARRSVWLLAQVVKYASAAQTAKLLRVAELVTRNQETSAALENFRTKVLGQHGASYQFMQRIQRESSPTCQKKFVQNLIGNELIVGTAKRRKFAEREGFRPPTFILISPTMRCNLNCIGCSTRRYMYSKKDDWPPELLDRVLTEAKEMGMYFVVTLGGETFMREDIFDAYEKHNDTYWLQYTNGTLIDENMARRLAQVGNVAPALSVEGFEKETDERRGKGTWKKIMRAAKLLKEEGVIFGFSATVTSQNAELVASDEFVDFLIDQGCLFGWYFQYIPIGNNPDVSLMATPEQRNQLRKFNHYVCANKPIFIGDFWNDGTRCNGCLAGGNQYLHINGDGNVEPCGFVHFAVDNIKDKSLKEVCNSEFFREIRRRQQATTAPDRYSDNLLTPCQIIDQPWVLREIVEQTGAFPTHEGAETIITDSKIKAHLDEYSKRLHELMDPIWEQEYQQRQPDYHDQSAPAAKTTQASANYG